MANVKVWNDGPTDYSEKFRDDLITIPKGKFIEMDYYDANQFLSQYIPPRKTETGIYLNHKQLRIDADLKAVTAEQQTIHACMVCGGKFDTGTQLEGHVKTYHETQKITEDPPAVRAQKGR